MLCKTLYLVTGIVCLAFATAVCAQDSPGAVHVTLSLADSKTSFRAGDQIKLILEFTADHEGYNVDTVTDKGSSPSDILSVSPDTGVFHWLEDYFSGGRFSRDYFALQQLSSTPTRVEVLVNSVIRFDRPGRYSVRVRTGRVTQRRQLNDRETQKNVLLTTNEVTFEVLPMSEADEAKEVERLSAALDAKRDWQSEERLTQELSFLSGDISSREKVRRFLNSEGRSGNYSQNISFGLYIARNRALVFQLLEAAMRDSDRPVTYQLLGTVTKLKLLIKNADLPRKPSVNSTTLDPFGDPQYNQILDAYVTELAASLAKRTGKSQTTTAITILSRLAKTPESAALREVRRLLTQQFAELDMYQQEYLLSIYGDQLRDSSLLPALKQMLKSSGTVNKNIHDAALRRLIEIAPAEARPFVVSEILNPSSLVDFEILRSLTDETLPEVDAALLEEIRRLSSMTRTSDFIFLKQKTSLAARYATIGIYQELMELYQQRGAKLPLESRACLLAYFARHNEKEALLLIEQVLSEIEPGQDFNFLPGLTRLYYSDGIDGILRKRLESDDPRAVSTSAWLISKYGPAADQQVIEARLDRWRKEWGNRAAEAQTNLQGTAEREMVTALIHAKSWAASPARLKELEENCITEFCRLSFPKRTQ